MEENELKITYRKDYGKEFLQNLAKSFGKERVRETFMKSRNASVLDLLK